MGGDHYIVNSTDESADGDVTDGICLDLSGLVHILQSTLRGNSAQYGGGIYHFEGSNNPNLRLDNTTLSGNTASRDGGGLYADGRFVSLDDVTVGRNRVIVPVGTVYDGRGGGL